PSGLKQAQGYRSARLSRLKVTLPLATDHTLNSPGSSFRPGGLSRGTVPTLASCLPSGLNVTCVTARLWPFSVRSSLPVSRSQILIVVSTEALASSLPSGLNARE